MGQEISHKHFSSTDFKQFSQRLKEETERLIEMFAHGEFSNKKPVGGFEIEGCLINNNSHPAPVNDRFLPLFNHPLATSELAKFNIELNNMPHPLKDRVFTRFEKDLHEVFKSADQVAHQLDIRLLLTGILQTLEPQDCCLENMSDMKRYHALNNVVVKARGGRPIKLDISGANDLHMTHDSVMLESATTSFQVHMQTPWEDAHHYYNAVIIASGPIMAITGNSPYLFGKQLWHETRIPVFEQSIDTGDVQRVSFGSGFAKESISECFKENLKQYPILLPMLFDSKPEKFKHLCLHNGVIWRWNRPLIGFDADGTPHCRIEHRILPAGPTIVDMVANAVFFYGLTHSLMKQLKKGEQASFSQAKNNFYHAAQQGLKVSLNWQGKEVNAKELILNELIPEAHAGLLDIGIDNQDINHYLGIIKDRTKTGQTGAVWQIEHVKKHKCTMEQLTKDYLHQQHLDQPVHTWTH